MVAIDLLGTEGVEDLWIFGYGSLMWRPGFEFVSRHKAVLRGWRRRLCIFSRVYRGTPERPGLVFGLDRGGECGGVAFRVDRSRRAETLQYLRQRELVTNVYIEMTVTVTLNDVCDVPAVAYVADRTHSQYAGALSRDRVMETVMRCRGVSGGNAEYVVNTYDHLEELGISDPELEWLAKQIRST